MFISVVGNAKSIFDNTYGLLIDSADLVIRFNRGAPVSKERQGKKTDILVFSNPKFKSAFPGGLTYWWTKKFPERAYLEKALGATPSNGTVSLERIKNNYPDDEVRIFGFDWKVTGTFWRDEHVFDKHDYTKEKEYCLRLIEKQGWTLYT